MLSELDPRSWASIKNSANKTSSAANEQEGERDSKLNFDEKTLKNEIILSLDENENVRLPNRFLTNHVASSREEVLTIFDLIKCNSTSRVSFLLSSQFGEFRIVLITFR